MSEKDKKQEIGKAKKVARANKKSKTRKAKRTYTQLRFRRPITKDTPSKPLYPKLVKRAILKLKDKKQQKASTDHYSVVKYPLQTEKAMKKMEEENTMVFICDSRANKIQIKESFQAIYNVKVRTVNTLLRPDGKKKAYIRLSSDSDSLSLANKINIL